MGEQGEQALRSGVQGLAASLGDEAAVRTVFFMEAGGTPEQAETIVSKLTNARPLPAVGLVLGDAPAAEIEGLAAMPGVLGARAFPGGLGGIEHIVLGLDRLASIDLLARSGDSSSPARVGGIAPGEPYPFMEGTLINLSRERTFATTAALMPVVNLSLGPSDVGAPLRADDPVVAATRAVARHQLPVFAAGNFHQHPEVETMSPWAETPWALAVGASADEAGSTLAEYSSTGVESKPDSGPDLIAWGASDLDSTVVGTSFAAPRVTRYAMIAAAGLLQLRHVAQLARGVSEGVPLVGYGVIDDFGDDQFPGPPRLPFGALPEVPVDRASLEEAMAVAQSLQHELDMLPWPSLLREMLLACTRPMSGYGPHQVGAGFISLELVLERLQAMSGRDLLRWSVGAGFDEAKASSLDKPLFGAGALETLSDLVQALCPAWRWDWKTNEFSMRPEGEL